MEVTYNMSRADQWRCNLYVMLHRPSTVGGLLIGPLIVAAWLLYLYHSGTPHHPLRVVAVILIVVLSISWYLALFAFMLKRYIDAKTPRADSQRICTTSITADGVRDVTPDQTQLLVWKDVKTIRFHKGDIYFWRAMAGLIVPRGAFGDTNEAQRFYQTALDFWRSHQGGSVLSSTTSIGFSDKLQAGEAILWQGQPNERAYGKSRARFVTMLLLGLVVAFTSFQVIAFAWELWDFVLFFWGAVAGSYFLCVRSYRDSARKIGYMVSDRRILMSEQKGSKSPEFTSMDLSQIDRLKYWKPTSGAGTVEFGAATLPSVTFASLDDVTTVARLVTMARTGQTDDSEAVFASLQKSDPFLGILHTGETLLWQGQPERGPFVSDVCGLRGGAIINFPLLGWLVMLAALDFSAMQPFWEQVAVLLPFIVLVVWILVRRCRGRSQEASATFYAVTSERLLILDQSTPAFFADVNLAKIQKMKREDFASGVGTLSFGGKNADDLTFAFIRNPSEVCRLVNAAKQKLSGNAMDWVQVAAERAKEPKPTWGSRLGISFVLLVLLWLPLELLHSTYYDIRYYNPGLRHYQKGEYAAAVADLRVAADATPNEQAPYYLGLALMHEGRKDQARNAFQQASHRALSGEIKDNELDAEAKSMIARINRVK